MLSKTAEYWIEFGLLDELDDEKSNELAKELENVASYLISKFPSGTENQPPAVSIIFPILRRLYTKIDKPGKFALIINGVDLFWDLSEKFKKAGLEEFMGSMLFAEAEFTDMYCEKYVEDLKKRGII